MNIRKWSIYVFVPIGILVAITASYFLQYDASWWSSIFANLSAGLLTGEIICIFVNMKAKERVQAEKQNEEILKILNYYDNFENAFYSIRTEESNCIMYSNLLSVYDLILINHSSLKIEKFIDKDELTEYANNLQKALDILKKEEDNEVTQSKAIYDVHFRYANKLKFALKKTTKVNFDNIAKLDRSLF